MDSFSTLIVDVCQVPCAITSNGHLSDTINLFDSEILDTITYLMFPKGIVFPELGDNRFSDPEYDMCIATTLNDTTSKKHYLLKGEVVN